MTKVSLPNEEEKRINALKLYDILDTLPEQEFDDLTQLASEICNTSIALISLIDENRQWFKSRVGLDLQETPREISFCTHAIESDSIFEVLNPLEDTRFADNPLVTGHPDIRFYAGAPLINKDGYRIGTLCVINATPHTINENQKNSLRILARSVISLLELRKEKKEAELFKKALDEVSIVAILNAKMEYEYANEKFCALANMRAEDIIGKGRLDIDLADVTDEQNNKMLCAISERKIYNGKIKNQDKNGLVTWSNLTKIPFTNKNNDILKILSIRNDITTEVLMVERLEEAERVAQIGNWEFNLITGGRYWSSGIYSILEYTANEADNEVPSLLNFTCPEDKEKVTGAFRNMLQGKEVPQLTEFKILTQKQNIKYIFVTHKNRYNSKGNLIGVYGTVQDITERKAVEKEVYENYLKVQDLYNNAPCGYHSLDENGYFIDINATELKWLGYTREEVIGKIKIKDILSPDAGPLFEADFEQLKINGHLKDKQRTFRRKDRTTFDTLVSATAVYNEKGKFIYSRDTVYDITELKKIQSSLEESEVKYRSLVEASSQMAFTTDAEGKFTYASPRLKKIIGYEDADIIGKQFAFIYDDEWRKKTILFYVKQLSEGINETTFLFPIKNAAGDKLWVEQAAILVKENGTPTGFTCVLHDVTESIKAHEAMAEASRLATVAKEMQETFLGKMSHEIRTPMNGVLGMANLLAVSTLSEKQKLYVDGIKESAANMLRIVNDILDVTKIQSGKMIFEETDFDLPHLINNVIFSLSTVADEKNVLLATYIDKKIPNSLIADPVRLTQILLNLGGNALKFTEEGSVIIRVTQKEAIDDVLILQFKITDTGIGIAKEKLDTIFESFTQAESDTTRKYGGTGLGLTIAKQLIEQQNGTINVTSEVGRGTTFSFTFYCKLNAGAGSTTASNAAIALKTAIPATQAASLQGCKILLVEDNIMNQRVGRFTLENWGVEVTIADRGAKAISLLRVNKYDLILMDIQMPEMNGMEATKIIRNELKNDTPIIAMTASAMRGEKEKCINGGMNDYISKPFEPEVLNQKINYYILKTKKPKEKIINIQYLKKIVSDDMDFAKEILEIYISKTPPILEEIDQLIDTAQYESLYTEIHNLKNSIGLLGATDLYALLVEIEADLYKYNPSADTLALIKKIKNTIIASITEAGELIKQL